MGAGLVLGISGAGLISAGQHIVTHAEPSHPPFLAARLLADGPGRVYLRKACASGSPYALCRFKNLPLDNSENILWFDAPGIVLTIDPTTRIMIQREEMRFAVSVLIDDPIGVTRATLNDAIGQLKSFWVEEPLRDSKFYFSDPYYSNTNLPQVLKANGGCAADGGGCAPKLQAWSSYVLHGAGLDMSLAAIAALLVLRRRLELWSAAGCLLFGAVLVNALVCAGISGIALRYEARMIWVLPLAAAIGMATVTCRAKNRVCFPSDEAR